MDESIRDLVAAVEREQAALVALIEANLKSEVVEEAAAMAERQRQMEPIMRRLGEATQHLVKAIAQRGMPADLSTRVEAWLQELSHLLGALQDAAKDFADRRALIISTLQRLNRTTKAVAGYRQPRAKGAKFIQKKA